jgi:RES domain-containing protein
LTPPATPLRLRNTWRLIPSRYPSIGILDVIASPGDLDAIIELESWTNDRISAELGLLYRVPREEWLTGWPMATVVMAAYCHPRLGGSRFNTAERGAWYASLALETAHAEVIFHRTQELAEIGVFETFVQVRAYAADFRAPFHDLRERTGAIYSRTSYAASQRLGTRLLETGSSGVIYRSVRHEAGVCIACFRPRLVTKVRQSAHYEYRWTGRPAPRVKKIG